MKIKDINVGEQYAVGTNASAVRATVLEVGVGSGLNSRSNDYVVVEHHSSKFTITVHESNIIVPWSVHIEGRVAMNMEYLAYVEGRDKLKTLHDAAPDLLAACVEFVRKCDCGEARSVCSYAQMKDAIFKATGGAK